MAPLHPFLIRPGRTSSCWEQILGGSLELHCSLMLMVPPALLGILALLTQPLLSHAHSPAFKTCAHQCPFTPAPAPAHNTTTRQLRSGEAQGSGALRRGGDQQPTTMADLVPPTTKATNLFMRIVVNPDGTVTRPEVPAVPPSPEPSPGKQAVLSRDVPLDAALGTYLRLYLPPETTPTKKLPVILYFHGGGFVIFSAATAFYHGYCEAMAAAVPAIVASLEYRRAPEHRLPAAYDDAVAAVRWLRDAAPGDPWVAARGDLSRCFVMGSSSGGNMAFFAGLRTRCDDLDQVRGLLLHQPYLGGVERTPSEAASEDDGILPLEANDKLWSLALPPGADRDHEFCNPAKSLPPDAVAGLPRCLVTGTTADPLIDRQREFAAWLKGRGVQVVEKTDIKGYHAVELFVPEKAQELCDAVREFVFADDV